MARYAERGFWGVANTYRNYKTKYESTIQHVVVDKDTVYRSGMEAAKALDDMQMPEQAKIIRNLAEMTLDAETRLEALIENS